MRVYIAGKVTGEPPGLCFAKFAAVEYQLKQHGFEVVNPMRLCNTDTPWSKCMRICLIEMLQSDVVFTLPDYYKSVGANIEVFISNLVSIPITRTISEIKKIAA